MSWLEVKFDPPDPLREAIVNFLFEMGAEGVNEVDTATVVAYFKKENSRSLSHNLSLYLKSLNEMYPHTSMIDFHISEIRDQNWAEECRKFFKAQKLGRSFFLVPNWEKGIKIPSALIPIYMEPGQAFGTGLHESTQLCVSLMEHTLDHVFGNSQIEMLDIGTGTGLLSIVGCKLGVTRVMAIDFDPQAIEAAKHNLTINQCKGVDLGVSDLANFESTPFDLVVSNILLETHLINVGTYKRFLKPRGQLILSGILCSQEGVLKDSFLSEGWLFESGSSLADWACLAFSMGNW